MRVVETTPMPGRKKRERERETKCIRVASKDGGLSGNSCVCPTKVLTPQGVLVTPTRIRILKPEGKSIRLSQPLESPTSTFGDRGWGF